MSSTTLVPVEEYLRYSDKPNCEYRDGVLYPKPLPTTFHGLLEFMLVAMLRAGTTGNARSDCPVIGHQVSCAGCDRRAGSSKPCPSEPVLLCCEILSPQDRLGGTLAKCEEYHAWGVPYCWVIDPVTRTAWEYHSAAEPVRVASTLRADQIAVSLEELFSVL